MKINSVISCSTSKHLNVWMYTSKYLTKYVHAENYYIIVPSSEVNMFKDNTPSIFKILNEEDIVSKEFRSKAGTWIYQQFLKMEASRTLGCRNLIWDSDTVPLKSMSDIFFPNKTDIQVFQSDEYHEPYFTTLHKLLDISKRLVDFSFIAQCLPVYSDDLELLKDSIENIHKKNWLQALIDATNSTGRFSEYETIGNFVKYKNIRNIIPFNGDWRRHIWREVKKFSDIDNLIDKELYYASFETTHGNAPVWSKNN